MLCRENLSLSQECPLFIFPIVLQLFVWLSLHRHCLRKCSPLSHSLSDNLLSWSAWHHIHFCSSTQWRREEIDFYLFSLLEPIYLFILSARTDIVIPVTGFCRSVLNEFKCVPADCQPFDNFLLILLFGLFVSGMGFFGPSENLKGPRSIS